MSINKNVIQEYILNKLLELSQDWDEPGEISPSSKIFSELGFESLDAVVLGVAIQEHYGVQMPFSELYAALGEQQKDLSVAELVDFVDRHVNRVMTDTSAASHTL